jgi:hypothetical protein
MELGGDLPAALALVRSGALPSEDLIAVATDALVDGLDSPSLRELAGIRKEDARRTGWELAERALAELGQTISDDASARRLLARAIAREIVTGAVSEFVGSRRLWGLFSGDGNYPDFAGALIGIEDEWEGGWGRTQHELRAEVRVVAAELLDVWGDPTSRSSRIHSNIRRWLEAEFDRWATDYVALHQTDQWQIANEDGTWHYSEAALALFPRYRIAEALLGEVERLRPSQHDPQQMRSAIGTCMVTEPVKHWLRYPAAAEELRCFADVVEGVASEMLSTELLPYRRTLTGDELTRRRALLEERFGVEHGWHPLMSADVPSDVLVLDSGVWQEPGTIDALRAVLVEHGVTVIVSLNDRLPCEVVTEVFDPSYGHDGEILASGKSPWFLIFTSHEGTTAFSPGPHIDALRSAIDCERWQWSG